MDGRLLFKTVKCKMYVSNIISGKTKLKKEICKSIVLQLVISKLLYNSNFRMVFAHNINL